MFLGIDYGRDNVASGAALSWNGSALRLSSLELLRDPAGVLAWVDGHCDDSTVAGVNIGFSAELGERDFEPGDRMRRRAQGRYQISVDPQAAAVPLYGVLAAGPAALHDRMIERLRELTPRLVVDPLPPVMDRDAESGVLQDRLDAITCAYVAAHWWYWGPERNELRGGEQSGYLVIPKRPPDALDLGALRETYGRTGLREADADPDPIRQFERWFAEARAAGLREPNAMTLATVSANGQPSARIVLLKSLDEAGFVFYSNYESQKGRELDRNPQAALVFYWAELERQVRITGAVEHASREVSEAYFHSRPRGSQLGALVSKQSAVIVGRAPLEAALADLEARYSVSEIPLPPAWGGFRLRPSSIEFWQGRANRLHDRLRYRREPDGTWIVERLSP